MLLVQNGGIPETTAEREERRRTSLRDVCSVLFRHKWKMLLFFLAAAAGNTAWTLTAAKIYQSEAKLLVRLGRESVALDPTATTGPMVPVVSSRESEIQTELEILKSHRIAERVADSLGVEAVLEGLTDGSSGASDESPGPGRGIGRAAGAIKERTRALLERAGLRESLGDRDKAILTIVESTRVNTEKDTSNIINLYFEAEAPALAQRVLTELMDAYLDERVSVHSTVGSRDFFAEQCRLSQQQLGDLEQQLKAALSGAGTSSIEEELRVTLDRIGSLETDIDRAESLRAASQARAEQLRASLAGLPETIVTSTTTGYPNVAADAMRERLYELQLREQELASKYNEESRQIQEIRRQIAEAQSLLSQEHPLRAQTTTAVNAARQQAESALLAEQANLTALEAEAGTLRQKLSEARAKLSGLEDTAAGIRRLKREIEIQEANYVKYAENLEQARIDQALDAGRISNIAVVQPATLPVKAVRPNRSLQLSLGLFFGLFGALVLASGCEYLDHTVKAPRDITEKLDLRALAWVPRVRAKAIRPIERVGLPRKSDVACDEDHGAWAIGSGVRDHYWALAHVILSGVNGATRARPRLLALAASHRGEGVSAVAANLAVALSHETPGRVLLVDANLANPSLHRMFDIEPFGGLVNILSNGDGCVEPVVSFAAGNLSLLPAGCRNGQAEGAFKSAEWASLLKRLKKEYRYVIVDLPALNEVTWAVRAASLCDGVGLVVEAERSRWEAIVEAKQQLLMSRAKILGVILNKRRFPVPRWLYDAL